MGFDRKSRIISRFETSNSAISLVLRFPVLSQMILGGWPYKFAKSKKSESNVTIVKLFSLA